MVSLLDSRGSLCRLPVAVGAFGTSKRKLATRLPHTGCASAQSTGEAGNGETSNEMYWTGPNSDSAFVSHLVAKPAALPKKAAAASISYQVVWQVGRLLMGHNTDSTRTAFPSHEPDVSQSYMDTLWHVDSLILSGI